MSELQQRQFILASGSPRRRELLGLTGFSFRQLSLDIDESVLPDERPAAYTLRVSRDKAVAASKIVDTNSIVLSADTTVSDGNTILGNPTNDDEDAHMLTNRTNRAQQLYTDLNVRRGSTDTLSKN